MKDFVSKEAALNATRKLHIGQDWDKECAKHVKRLLARDEDGNLLPKARVFTRTGETRGVMLVGAPGSGKTHLAHQTLSKIPELSENTVDTRRLITCSVPSPATFKSMTLALLKESGYQDANPRQEAWSLWDVFRHRLGVLGVAVLWIDEAHDLFCADSKKILRAFKTLMQGDNAVAVVLSGTHELADVVRPDEELKRRFTTMELPKIVESIHGDMYREIIKNYCGRVGLEPPVEADLMGRVFYSARYRFGSAVELLLMAMECAIEDESDYLTIDHFASAYAMNEACSASENVFYVDNYHGLDPDREGSAFSSRGRPKRRG